MATTPNDPHKVMEREVNRLLAQLAYSGAEPIGEPRSNGGAAAPQPVARARVSGPSRSVATDPRWNVAALWGRAILAVALGGAMILWPYPRACGWALLGYLGAVAAVLLAGGWVAFASWRLRSGATHLVSLVLFYWGLVLAAEQVLPRIGYASDPAAWLCGEIGRFTPPNPR